MRSVGGDISQERFFRRGGIANETIGLFKEHVAAKAFGSHNFAVVKVSAVKISVVPHVGGLADAAAAVTVDFGVAAVFGAIWVVVAQVPFTKHARLITGIFE